MSQKQTSSTKTEQTKQIKVRVITEDGDLGFGLIEVPMDDKRPAYNPATDTLGERGAQQGNPEGGR